MKTLLIALPILLLAGCKTIPVDPNIATMAQIHAADANARAEGFRACAMANDVSACMLGIVATTAVSAEHPAIQGYQRPPTPAEQFIDFAKALTPAIGGLASAAVSWRQSDNNRDVAIAQYGYLEGIIRHTAQAASTVAGSGPSIVVGGNLGDTRTYGNDYTGGDRDNTAVGRDMAGGDISNQRGIFGDGIRIDSDDNSRNGAPCYSGQGGNAGSSGAGGDAGDCRAGDGG